MSDEADRSDDKIQNIVNDGLAKARREIENGLVACGACYWCESPVGRARVFCSAECSQDWQHEKKRSKELGL